MEHKYLSSGDLGDYPDNMQAKHISDFLGIGVGTVYKILESGEIPVLSLPGCKLKLIPKPAFVEWYNRSVFQKTC